MIETQFETVRPSYVPTPEDLAEYGQYLDSLKPVEPPVFTQEKIEAMQLEAQKHFVGLETRSAYCKLVIDGMTGRFKVKTNDLNRAIIYYLKDETKFAHERVAAQERKAAKLEAEKQERENIEAGYRARVAEYIAKKEQNQPLFDDEIVMPNKIRNLVLMFGKANGDFKGYDVARG